MYLSSVFVTLDTVRSWWCYKHALLQKRSSDRSFLIFCSRVSINNQLKYTISINGLFIFVFWYQVLPSNFLNVSFCLTRSHIDWKEER